MIYTYLILYKKREMIFVQLLYNFLSHTHIIFLFSLFLFLSLLFLTNKKREQQCYPKIVQLSLLIRKC